MNLTEKSELNYPQVWLTSSNFCKTEQHYPLVERMPRICEAVIAAKGSDFDESEV